MVDLEWSTNTDWTNAQSTTNIDINSGTFELADAIPDSALTQDLVAWYRFEDGDARDYASSAEFPNVTWGDSTAYDGTVNGATYQSNSGVTDFRTGTNSGTFDFNGSDDDIDCNFSPSDVGVGGASAKSVCCWAFIRSFDGGGIFQFGATGTFFADFSLITLSNDGHYRGQFWADGDIDFIVGGASEWHHFVVSYDGSTMRIFADGTQVGSQTDTYDTNDHPFLIGVWDGQYLDGLIDDVRVYNKGLTQSEASEIYENTKP